MSILSLQDLENMALPIDLSGYTPDQLTSKLRQAETWVNGECRYARAFDAHRVFDRVYGTGTNKLRTTFYPVMALNSISIIFPPNVGSNVNLPGPNQVPIDPGRVVIDHEAGMLYNWSPFIFQTIGYMTVFPEGVPINIDYYTGYVAVQTTSSLSVGQTLIPVTNASCFYWSQTIEVFDDANKEYVTVQGATTIGLQQFVVSNEPLQYAHQQGVTVGDMPPEIRLATAYVLCDFCLRELNPEDLQQLKVDKVTKVYKTEVRPVAGADENGYLFENERSLIKEARRLIAHYYSDRGIS